MVDKYSDNTPEDDEGEYITCSCCGVMLRNNARQNADYGKVPYPQDEGFGHCRSCGGYPVTKAEEGKPMTEAQVKKKLGWAACSFYESRFPIIRQKLAEIAKEHPEKAHILEKWDKMTYLQHCEMVIKSVEKGWMI